MDKKKEGEESGMCGKATKGTAREEAGIPCKGKSAGRREEAKKSRRKRSGARG